MATTSTGPPPTVVKPVSGNGTPEARVPDAEKTPQGPFALRQLVRDYFIPVETNNIWYALGGVLAIALALEIFTGFLLMFKYTPAADKAYDITKSMIEGRLWSVVINFHYWTSFVIFGLIMIHMVRVFISGGYKRGKWGLWQVGVGLAALTFVISLTGEALHWDEVGFGVPWNVGEFFEAIGLAGAFNYTTDGLLQIGTATEKLSQIYAVHIALVPILLLLFIGMHYYLVRVKGISMPFWLRPSGRKAPFTEHIRVWLIYGGIAVLVLLLVSIFIKRDPGTAPQLLQTSPLFNQGDDPGGLGFKPTFPISWTRGMNVVVASLGMDPDIWGAVIGMVILAAALILIPVLDRGGAEPQGWAAAFSLRRRGWAFAAMAVFWFVLLLGTVVSAITAAG